MSYIPQRIFESAFAWSPQAETAFGTQVADAFFTHGCQPQGFDPPGITRQFRSDAGKAWGQGADRVTTRAIIRQDIAYALNFELSALLAAHVAGCCMGKVVSTLLAAGPPAAYKHVISFQDPIIDGLDLPSTGHWFKPADDLGLKTKGAVCSEFSLGYSAGQPLISLNSNWLGNGDYVNADLAAIPPLDTDVIMGTLFEKGLDIRLGAPAAATSIADRVAAISLQVGNGVGETERHYPGTGLYGGRAWQGKRIINPSLTVFAKATDDIHTLFELDTEQELEIEITGELITGTSYFSVLIVIPSLQFANALKIGAQGNFVAWELSPTDEGVFQKFISKVIDAAPTGAVRASNVVTITTTASHGANPGDYVTIAGVTDSSFNGSFYIASTPAPTTFTYAQTATDAGSGAGTAEIKVAPIRMTVVNKEEDFLLTS